VVGSRFISSKGFMPGQSRVGVGVPPPVEVSHLDELPFIRQFRALTERALQGRRLPPCQRHELFACPALLSVSRREDVSVSLDLMHGNRMNVSATCQATLLTVCLLSLIAKSKRSKRRRRPFRIVATDAGFEAPDTLAAGLRHITFENRGSEIHEGMLVKLPTG